MLNSESRHVSLVPDPNGKAFDCSFFSLLSMLAIGFSLMLFISLKKFSFTYILLNDFIMKNLEIF